MSVEVGFVRKVKCSIFM